MLIFQGNKVKVVIEMLIRNPILQHVSLFYQTNSEALYTDEIFVDFERQKHENDDNHI